MDLLVIVCVCGGGGVVDGYSIGRPLSSKMWKFMDLKICWGCITGFRNIMVWKKISVLNNFLCAH